MNVLGKLRAVWDKLDGLKTLIAGVVAIVYVGGGFFGLWPVQEDGEIAKVIVVLGGGGLFHKLVKYIVRTA